MLNKLKLKVFGRRRIPGTGIESCPESTAKPDRFYINCYYSEEVLCRDCGKMFVHTASEKQSYFEVEKGNIYKQFVRCRECDECRSHRV